MKKLLMMLMLLAPMAAFAQKFGHINAQEVMAQMPEFIKARGEVEAAAKQYDNDLKAMQEELQRIWQTEKRTIIFVTNNIEEALYLADRIIVLSNCPATVKKEFVIDLPRPRDYVSPEFLELRKEITSIMDSTL